MKLLLIAILSSMILVAACAQQAPQAPAPQPAQQPAPPQAAPEPEPAEVEEPAEEQPVEERVAVTSSDEVRILGEEGFEPTEVTISAGGSVTWFNDDSKTFTMTMFKDGKFFQNSPVLNPGSQFEQQFNEPGEYEYWTLAYGPKGAKIIVE